MPMDKDSQYFMNIQNYLAQRVVSASKAAAIGHTELAILSENFYCDFLNALLNCDFKNVNVEKRNAEGIDLIDWTNKIAAQVSATCSPKRIREKIQSSINKFEIPDEDVWHFYFVPLSIEAPSIEKGFVQKEGLTFNPQKDVLDIGRILELTQTKPAESPYIIDKLEMLSNLVDKYRAMELNARQQNRKNKKWEKTKTIAKTMGLITITIVIVFGLIAVAIKIIEPREKKNLLWDSQYAYELSASWMNLQEAATVLSNSSSVKVYNFAPETMADGEQAYYGGAGLIAIYQNLTEKLQIINGFKITCSNVKLDYHPYLDSFYSAEDLTVYCTITNTGWGQADQIKLTLSEICRVNEAHVPIETLRNIPEISFQIQSGVLSPGESTFISVMQLDSLIEDYDISSYPDGLYRFTFDISAISKDENNDKYKTITGVIISKEGNTAELYAYGGDVIENILAINVDVSHNTDCERVFNCLQEVPGGNAVKIPIFVFPNQSCKMNIEIEFRTKDGEMIHAGAIENAHFIVSCIGNNYYNFIDGASVDIETFLSEFPDNKTVSFPYREASVILGEEVQDNDSTNTSMPN